MKLSQANLCLLSMSLSLVYSSSPPHLSYLVLAVNITQIEERDRLDPGQGFRKFYIIFTFAELLSVHEKLQPCVFTGDGKNKTPS